MAGVNTVGLDQLSGISLPLLDSWVRPQCMAENDALLGEGSTKVSGPWERAAR